MPGDPQVMHPAVQGMLVCLPKDGEKWSLREQSQWLRAFAQVLTVCHIEAEDQSADLAAPTAVHTSGYVAISQTATDDDNAALTFALTSPQIPTQTTVSLPSGSNYVGGVRYADPRDEWKRRMEAGTPHG